MASLMQSDDAKVIIICAVVASGFAAVTTFLLCLLCPCCPLKRLIGKCIRGDSKKLTDTTSSCLKECFEETSSIKPTNEEASHAYGGVQPVSYPKAWEQKRLDSEPKPFVTLTFTVTRQTDCLVVYLYKADGTPGPKMGLCHNNFAQVQLSDADRQLAIADVRTRIVCQTMSPVFNETLILTVPPEPPAERLSLCIQCLDFDRFSQERVVGEVRVPLPAAIDQTVQYNSVMGDPPLAEKGELLIALHYMPTAERLSVLLLKANNLHTAEWRVPVPYLQVVLLTSGFQAFKKRTRIFDESPRPVFNESVNIAVPRHSLDRVTLIVSLMHCHLRKRPRPDLDSCLGYVVFSSGCYGSGKVHWTEMMARPRTPLAYWHKLS